MRGFYIGLPDITAALFSNFDWYFSFCIFSRSVDIAVFTASGFSAKKSKGTRDMIIKASHAGIPFKIYG